jgi:hypothetical protein
MLKPVIGGVATALLYFPPVIAQTQTQQSSSPVLAQTSAPTRSSETVSPLEIQQFAQALKQLKKIEMETQEKIVAALKQERLSPERFQEIGQQLNNPDLAGTTQITPTEQERFEKAIAKIQTIRQEVATKESRAVSMQGLTEERFNQIGQIINQNPALKQQLQNSLNSGAL